MNWNRVSRDWIMGSSALLMLSVFLGCSGDRGQDHSGGHGHAHHAPHGGALTMLGNHAFQLELLANAEAKRLELYILDGGAENFVRITSEAFEGVASAGGQEWKLNFNAVASEATGETVGDSSYFVAETESVSELARFEISIDQLDIRGQVFESVRLFYPEGAH